MKNDLSAEQLAQAVTVTLPLGVVLKINDGPEPIQAPTLVKGRGETITILPVIGSAYQGGIYAGLTLEGEQPVMLVLLPGDDGDLSWDKAKAWAEKRGGVLPSRIDQLVLFKNLKNEFENAWYWSGEQAAGAAGYAWYQLFGYGDQLTSKDGKLRARAVRRLAIQ